MRCDLLGALAADPTQQFDLVAFDQIEPAALTEACPAAIAETDDAFNFYCYTQNLGNNHFLYYPETDNEGVVPGFVSENDRYRKEAVLSLHNEKSKYICIGTERSFFNKDLPVNTGSIVKKFKMLNFYH